MEFSIRLFFRFSLMVFANFEGYPSAVFVNISIRYQSLNLRLTLFDHVETS